MLVLQVFQEHHDDVKQCYYVWFPLMSGASGPHTATQTFVRMELVGGEGAGVPHAGLRCELIVYHKQLINSNSLSIIRT